ncbi:UDP-N-acetylglucosamine transferase subunit ALG13 homolog [Pararge aegeria]|uniref:UDP-N-acetylglucosamine transferase subunit ALG13 n=2 Tax=Pararge aegeria TaxID=116150 RepID=A0A8S4R1Y8_9NEOP|nr:UDP-N-acetylglucosamine transferase subunit ALG13 homolog [Pararge aegeria]CAH2229792.1 jg5804 [Pararge aegeria aegeria]
MHTQQKYKKCFITVGTTRFDLLCKRIQTPEVLRALNKLGCKEITFQIGNSDFEPGCYEKEGVKIELYRFKDSLKEDMQSADLIISHAGAGSCLEALDEKKPLLVVINEDLMDNHQMELAEQLHMSGNLYYCTCDTLENTLETVDFSWLRPLAEPVPHNLTKYLDKIFTVTKLHK